MMATVYPEISAQGVLVLRHSPVLCCVCVVIKTNKREKHTHIHTWYDTVGKLALSNLARKKVSRLALSRLALLANWHSANWHGKKVGSDWHCCLGKLARKNIQQ